MKYKYESQKFVQSMTYSTRAENVTFVYGLVMKSCYIFNRDFNNAWLVINFLFNVDHNSKRML